MIKDYLFAFFSKFFFITRIICPDILREKSLAIKFGDSQLRRNRFYNFIISKIYVDKRL